MQHLQHPAGILPVIKHLGHCLRHFRRLGALPVLGAALLVLGAALPVRGGTSGRSGWVHLILYYHIDTTIGPSRAAAQKVGCYIDEIFFGIIIYANDIALLAPSRAALQIMVDVCAQYGYEWDISFNPEKLQA